MAVMDTILGILGMPINHGPIQGMHPPGAMAITTATITGEVATTMEEAIMEAITTIILPITIMDTIEEIPFMGLVEEEVAILEEILQIEFPAKREEKNLVQL